MVRHYAPLTSELFDEHFLNRREVLRVTDFGAHLGFAVSVLEERGFFAASAAAGANPKSPPPLLTWPFLDFVDSLDLGKHSLLELGAGRSTTWFAERFATVRSFETDPEWCRSVAREKGANVELSLTSTEVLERGEVDYRGEDWLVVDFAGKRTKFLQHFLARSGSGPKPMAVVLDNADWYRKGASLLQGSGYLEIPFFGFKSTQSWISCTSVFIDPGRFDGRPRAPFFQPPFSRRTANQWDSTE